MICRWDQYILGYHSSIVNRSNKIMTDVNALTRINGKSISQYCIIASILYSTYKQRQPKVYEGSVFTKDNISKNDF